MWFACTISVQTGRWVCYWDESFTTRAAAWGWAATHQSLGQFVIAQAFTPTDPAPAGGTVTPFPTPPASPIGAIIVLKGPCFINNVAVMLAFGVFVPDSAAHGGNGECVVMDRQELSAERLVGCGGGTRSVVIGSSF